MTRCSFFKLLAVSLAGWLVTGQVYARDAPGGSVRVAVLGCVTRPGKYRPENPATIEQALAKAGGWDGKGGLGPDGGMPARWCAIHQHRNHQLVTMKFAVSVDRETKKITVVGARWKDYHLANGDGLEMPRVFF